MTVNKFFQLRIGSCPWPREMVCQGTFLEIAKARNWPVGSMPGVRTNLELKGSVPVMFWVTWKWGIPKKCYFRREHDDLPSDLGYPWVPCFQTKPFACTCTVTLPARVYLGFNFALTSLHTHFTSVCFEILLKHAGFRFMHCRNTGRFACKHI